MTILALCCIAVAPPFYVRLARSELVWPDQRRSRQNQAALSVKQAAEDLTKLLRLESSNLITLDNDSRVTPTYLWGDFNGDGAIDVVMVASLNTGVVFDIRHLSAFVIDKARSPGSRNGYKFLPEALENYRDTPFLVIFHGANGTTIKDFQVRERFIVLDGMDEGPLRMTLHRGKLDTVFAGDEPRAVIPPKPVGDAVLLLWNDNSGTAVLWYGGKYYWYPVEKPSRRKPRLTFARPTETAVDREKMRRLL